MGAPHRLTRPSEPAAPDGASASLRLILGTRSGRDLVGGAVGARERLSFSSPSIGCVHLAAAEAVVGPAKMVAAGRNETP